MSDKDDDISRPDMTRIEDLSEFLHEEDPEADAQLDLPSTPDKEDDDEGNFETMSLDELEEDDSPPAFADSDPEEDISEESTNFSSEESDASAEEEEESFSSESTKPDFEVPSFGDDDSEEEEASFDSENETDFKTSSFDEKESDEDNDFSLEEMDSLDEEAQLHEEVDNEIREALHDVEDSGLEDQDEADEEIDSFELQDEAIDFSSSEEDAESDNQFEQEESQFESADDDQEDVFETLEESTPDSIETPNQTLNSSTEDSFSQAQQEQTKAGPRPREDFKDLNEFGNAISYGQVAAGGNPPFSIVLRKIKYLEDSERIIEILREHGLCDESNENDFQQGLNNGSMLVSQLNEYSAIYLAHKFRRFDLEILVGLSDEVHPSKNYDMDYKGLIRKENLTQNKHESFSLEEQIVQVEAILLATTPTLENYRIDRYLGLVSAHIMIEEEDFQKLQETDLKKKDEYIDPDELLNELGQEDSASKTSSIEIGLEEIYQNLAESLKVKAFKMKGNAVVGINYQITPLINQKPAEQSPTINYKISCTGNTVWVGGKEAPRSEA